MIGMLKKDRSRVRTVYRCRYAANGIESNERWNMSCNPLVWKANNECTNDYDQKKNLI